MIRTIIVATVMALFYASPAAAQEADLQRSFTYCFTSHYVHPARSQTMAMSNIFETRLQVPANAFLGRSDGYFWDPTKSADIERLIPKSAGGLALGQDIASKLLNPAAPFEVFHVYCRSFPTRESAEPYYAKDGRNNPNIADYVATPRSVALSDWGQGTDAGKPQSQVRTFTVDFQPGEIARRGYTSASIGVSYRFLLCADEIQIAYGLDRKSLEHSRRYVAGAPLRPGTGTPLDYAEPSSEPPFPNSIPIAWRIFVARPGQPYVTTVRDGIAGEALGMGCFTGQTKTLGLVSKLVGPKATRPEIKAYLDLLRAVGAASTTGAAQLDFPLINPNVPVPAGAMPVAPRTGSVRVPVPPVIDDSPQVRLANAAGAAAARAQSDKILADKAAYRANVQKAKADYEAKMVRYRQDIADQNARNEAIQRAGDARMAQYRLCVAGDKAACGRYNAQ